MGERKIEEAELRHIASLSRLALPEDRVEALRGELGDVLSMVERLSELDVSDVEPMAHAGDVLDAVRADEPAEPLTPERALENAPASDGPYLRVPKVLNEEGSA